MKFLKYFLYVVLAIVALVLIWALFLPSKMTISAESTINQPVATVYHAVASFQDRDKWDPWLEMDSTATAEFDYKEGYVGSTYTWAGPIIKTGKMEVVGSECCKQIKSHIWFDGMEDHSVVEWAFEEVEGKTNLKWSFTAEGGYPMGRIYLFMMEKSMPANLEKGLANLKEHMETPVATATLSELEEKEFPAMDAMIIAGEATLENVGSVMEKLFGALMVVVGKQNLEITGHAFSRCHEYNEADGSMKFVVGVPVKSQGTAENEVVPQSYPVIKAVAAVHTGPYEALYGSYEKIEQQIKEKELNVAQVAWEFYLTDMEKEPDNTKWQTLIAFPLVEK